MTIEQMCCICIGFAIQAATFILGILVGATLHMQRKESQAWRDGKGIENHRHRP